MSWCLVTCCGILRRGVLWNAVACGDVLPLCFPASLKLLRCVLEYWDALWSAIVCCGKFWSVLLSWGVMGRVVAWCRFLQRFMACFGVVRSGMICHVVFNKTAMLKNFSWTVTFDSKIHQISNLAFLSLYLVFSLENFFFWK